MFDKYLRDTVEDRNLPGDEQQAKHEEGRGSGERDYNRSYGRGRTGFNETRPFRAAPVKVGEEFEVKIESMSRRGDAGVAKVEGLVIFVAGTKVGDDVRIRITKVGRGYATADVAPSQTLSEPASEPD